MRGLRTLLVLTATVLLVAAPSIAGDLTETLDKTFDMSAGGTLVLSNENGSVTIGSWDQPKVRIRVEKKVEAGDDDVARKAMRELKIEIAQSGNRLEVETKTPKNPGGLLGWLVGTNISSQVRYEVTVPRDLDMRIETVNGRIRANEVRGTIELSTTNGAIEVVDASGAVNASTTNGHIHAELHKLSGKAMSFETTNGGVTVELPADAKATLDASTTNGGIRTDFAVTSSSFGRDRIRGTINGGGPDLRVRTTNGSVKILKGSA